MNPPDESVVAVQVTNLDRKLDERFTELKQDLVEVKEQTQKTNGRVTGLERGQAMLKGIGLCLVALTPFVVFALQRIAH